MHDQRWHNLGRKRQQFTKQFRGTVTLGSSGGSLDLTNDTLVIDYGVSSPISTVQQMQQDHRLTSSSATSATGLGYADTSVDSVTAIGCTLDNSSLVLSSIPTAGPNNRLRSLTTWKA